MSSRVSLVNLGPDALRQAKEQILAQARPPKKSKYSNVRTAYKSTQGFERIYDSKGEARYAATLDHGIEAGLIKWWLPQVPIPLPGGVKLVVDFLVQWTDRLAFMDFKGVLTREAANKIKQANSLFGIDVELVRK